MSDLFAAALGPLIGLAGAGDAAGPAPSREAVRERFEWAVRVRWLAIAGFLSLGVLGWQSGVVLDPLPCALAALGASLLNSANQIAVRKWRNVAAVTLAAVVGDVLLITFLVVRSGGAWSPFTAMYTVQVLATAMLVELRVALACAAGAVSALAAGIAMNPSARYEVAFDAASYFPVWAAFFACGLGLVAYVGGYVSEQLRRRERALEQSNTDLGAALAALAGRNAELRETCDRLEQTERQLAHSEKMRALGDFVAGVAHELNNPTGIVAANLELLEVELERLGSRDENVDEILADCRDAARRAGRIVADLRQFSHTGGRRQWTDFDLNEVVRRTTRLARHLFGKGVAITLDLQPLPMVRGVPSEIEQVALNLLSNAAQAVGSRGAVEVSTAVARAESDAWAILRVADDGPGVPAEVADRVFEPFFTTRGAGVGVGLGLSMAFAIAARHGGKLGLDRSVDRGACFELALPLGSAEKGGALD
jgi:signal transduction histidine kinase